MANSFVGTWNTSWTGAPGASQLTIGATGTGSYPTGTIGGAFDAGNLSYSGLWTDNSGGRGSFNFVLVGTDTFIGVWVTSDGSSSGQWNGTINNR